MFKNSEELLRYVKDERVEMIDVRFCDLPGVMQHFTVPVSSFDQSVFDDGLSFDGSSIRGFQAIHESDMSLFPDPTTAYLGDWNQTSIPGMFGLNGSSGSVLIDAEGKLAGGPMRGTALRNLLSNALSTE